MDDSTTVKRLNYFDHQFLRANDFSDEQGYHVRMRRLHNQLLHTWGIASGLDVTFQGGGKSVTVASGVALDDLGREIVVPVDQTVELSSFDADADLYLTIAYDEQETDETAETGASGKTRTTEQWTFNVLKNAPGNPGRQLVLALVQRTGTEVTGVDAGARRVAGTGGGSLDVLGLGLRDPAIVSTGWVRMRLEAAKRAFLDGSLHISGGLNVDGDLSAGGSLRAAGNASVNNAFVGDVGHGSIWAGFSHASQISQKSYALLQSSDGLWTFLNKRSGGGAIQFRVDNNARLTMLDNGNLGVGGMSAPAQSLHSLGNALFGNTFLGDVGHGPGFAGFSHASQISQKSYGLMQSADGLWTVLNKRSGGGAIQFRVDNNAWLTMLDNGFLGLNGVTTPSQSLHSYGNGLFNSAFLGDVGHGPGFAGFSHANQISRTTYGLLQSVDGFWTLVNKKSGGGAIQFRVDNKALLTMLDNGNLGIGGVGAPAQSLHSPGNALIGNTFLGDVGHGPVWAGFSHANQVSLTSYALLQSNDGLNTFVNKKSGGGAIQFRSDNSPLVTILDNGNVGIGVSPATKLHVAGPSRFQGDVAITDDALLYTGPQPTVTTPAYRRNPTFSTGEVHVWGPLAGWSFGDRKTTEAGVWENVAGRRWVLYSDSNVARLWTNLYGDRLWIDGGGNLTVAGSIKALGGKSGYVTDQFINNAGRSVEEGDVVVLASDQAGATYGVRGNIPIPEVDPATRAYDHRVCGIVAQVSGEMALPEDAPKRRSRKPPPLTELEPKAFSEEEIAKRGYAKVKPGQVGHMVTLGAFAHCKVDAGIAPIEVGDLLTTSPTRGHAQKVLEPERAIGAIIGKALAAVPEGKAKIPVMVLIQ